MKVSEFVNAYNLHDSLLEKIEYDSINKKLFLEIDFCYWAQSAYKEGEKENGIIQLSFLDVNNFSSEISEADSDSILAFSCINDNQLKIIVETDNSDVLSINFSADSVDVIEC